MPLRDYQKDCLRTIRAHYRAGIRRQLVCLPTGTGKTVIFAEFPRFFGMKNRMLVLAHREELLTQARDKIRRAEPSLSVEIEQAGRRAGADSDVVVASVPTLGRQGSRRLARLDPREFYLIVVDEAHHATAATYRRVFEHFGLLKNGSPRLLVGFTATPKRGDGQGLDAVFQEITYARSLPDMIEAGFLAPLAAYRVETDVDLSRVRTRMGDFVAGQLSKAVNIDERNELIVRVYTERLRKRRTLCFCVDVAHAHSLAARFRRAGIASKAVTGEMPREDRASALEGFREGRFQVLTNCMVLTEGYDEPAVSGILLARPTKSSLLYAQMIGRGTRLHPGKKNVVIVDIVDVTRDNKLVCLPTLFGLPDNFDLEGHTTREVEKALKWVEENRPWVRTDLAASLRDLRYRCRRIDLFDLRVPEEIADVSEYAWIEIGRGCCRLNLGRGERVMVAPTILGEWEVVLERADGETTVASAADRRRAVRSADAFVEANRKEAVPLVLSRSRWRRQPPSARQLDILRRLRLHLPRGLTKGQASHLIGMLPPPGPTRSPRS